MNTLAMVRPSYLGIAQWAVDDPARWGPWAVPCPIRDDEMSRKKERSHRKSRMDQRTRERLPVLPVLPVLIAAVDAARTKTAEIRLTGIRIESSQNCRIAASCSTGTPPPASWSRCCRSPPRPRPIPSGCYLLTELNHEFQHFRDEY